MTEAKTKDAIKAWEPVFQFASNVTTLYAFVAVAALLIKHCRKFPPVTLQDQIWKYSGAAGATIAAFILACGLIRVLSFALTDLLWSGKGQGWPRRVLGVMIVVFLMFAFGSTGAAIIAAASTLLD